MAEMLTITEIRNYELSTGQTVNLEALIATGKPEGWTKGHGIEMFAVGQVVYVDALGEWRRGVVTKVAKTKVNVAITTTASQYMTTDKGLVGRVQNSPYHAAGILADADRDEAQDAPAEIEAAPEVEETGSAPTAAPAEDVSGSAIVAALEDVWTLIRANHPEVPAVVLVTGAGIVAGLGSSRWGHFRQNGWEVRTADEEAVDHSHGRFHGEVFIAGETLAAGGLKTVQTMLHEAAHVLAVARELQDTSRQGRWHNATFRKLAEELGLEYVHPQANKSIGFSAVTMTPGTADEYADVIKNLDEAIRLVIKAPSFMTGGSGNGDDEGSENVHGAGRKTREPGTKSSNNIKATCACEEPRIIRVSRAVLAGAVIRCEECDGAFLDRSED